VGQVNQLMNRNQTFSCFVVDRLKYSSVDLHAALAVDPNDVSKTWLSNQCETLTYQALVVIYRLGQANFAAPGQTIVGKPVTLENSGLSRRTILYGLEAINAHNGWAMAITGAIIVMTGLTVLSTIISQLHRIIDFMENRKSKKAKTETPQEQPPVKEIQSAATALSNLGDRVDRLCLMTTDAGDSFDLITLHQLFIQNDDPHPHLTIRSLREQGYLVPTGEGRFTWKR